QGGSTRGRFPARTTGARWGLCESAPKTPPRACRECRLQAGPRASVRLMPPVLRWQALHPRRARPMMQRPAQGESTMASAKKRGLPEGAEMLFLAAGLLVGTVLLLLLMMQLAPE